jgi:leucyl/phenylalanyl-tRNA--protein transferase
MKNLREKLINVASAVAREDMPLGNLRKMLVKYTLALSYPLWPSRLSELPGLIWMTLRYWLSIDRNQKAFPDLQDALSKPDGLLLVGGKLDCHRILEAYRRGIYPHSHIGLVKWYAPKERMVLFPKNTHISKGVRKLIRKMKYKVTFDKAFHDVIEACAKPRSGKTPLTWINKSVIKAYSSLFEKGYAHSVETWDENDHIVGGLFGVNIGKIFFSESMFYKKSNASKVASAYLNCHLYHWGYGMIDFKMYTKLAEAEGANMIPREEFTALIKKWRDVPGKSSPWQVDETLNVGNWKPLK